LSKRFLFLESKVNDTVVRVQVEEIRKVAGEEGWGRVGEEFTPAMMRLHRHGWSVTDEPKADEPEAPFRDGDILKNRYTHFLYYYLGGRAERLSPVDSDDYVRALDLGGCPGAWSAYEVVYSDPSIDG
jgi:hypothetical protein